MSNKDEHLQVRTDLAIEAKEMFIQEQEKEEDETGVTVKHQQMNGIKIDHVIVDERGSKNIGKKQGSYITIYADGVKKQDTKKQTDAAEVVAKQLVSLLKENKVKKFDVG